MTGRNFFIPFKTSSGNCYVYESNFNQVFPVHPFLYFFLKKNLEKDTINDWFENLNDNYIIIDDLRISRKQLKPYYKKFLSLMELGLFSKNSIWSRLDGKIKGKDIREMFANVRQVTFETTDRCQLYCGYCGYGKFYNDYDKRENNSLSIKTAQNVLDFFLEYWNSPLNNSHGKKIYIGFYGGEPLLNIKFLREVVEYVNKLPARHNGFTFAITTNAVSLEKYMDFMVRNDFNILISLDGSRKNTQYRVFRNGKPAFDSIIKNINSFRRKYPEYFRRKVNFNAVIHNKNSVTEIHRFFKEKFDKVPSISELNTGGIKESQKKIFWKTYININESLKQSENYEIIEKDMFINLPGIRSIGNFLTNYSGFVYKDYNDLLYSKANGRKVPTGTCLPFSKKVFVTVNGKILPCERIAHRYALGLADEKRVILDTERIAETYNNYYVKMRSQCSVCYRNATCTQCMFYIDLDDEKPICSGFMNREEFSNYLSIHVGYLENKPGIYSRLMKEAVIE